MKNLTLAKLLIENNLTIGFVESFTGGLAAAKLVDIPGVSKVFLGSLVTYSSLIKESLLNIDKEIIDQYDVVSKEVASLMAKSGKEILKADIIISFTGDAGPTTSNEKIKVGTGYIGILFFDELEVVEFIHPTSRNKYRYDAISLAFDKLIKKIKNYRDKKLN